MARFLGVDYGMKRVGIAISDEAGKLAFPKDILENSPTLLGKLGKIIMEEQISEIVIGESTDFSGKPNTVAKDIEKFISEAQKEFSLPIEKQKEFLTSVEARRYQEKPGPVDASAAALILQRYLDKKNNFYDKH